MCMETDHFQLFRRNTRGLLTRFNYFHKKLSRNYIDYGLWISCKKSVAYIFQPLYKKVIYYLYELDLNKYANAKIPDSKYVFRLIQPDETHLIDQVEEMEEWLKGSLKKNLMNHSLCMVVMDGEKLIGFNYAAIGEAYIPLLKLKIVLEPTEAWSEQITISSDYRRQGLGSLLRIHFYQTLKAQGMTALYGHRQEFNTASKQSARKFTAGIMVRVEYKHILWNHRLKCIKSIQDIPQNGHCFFIDRQDTEKTADSLHTDRNSDVLFTARIEDLK